MTAVPAIRILPIGFLAILLLFSFISRSVCVEFTEDAGKLDKVNVLRNLGKQWATGHFMGKRIPQDNEQDMEEATMYPSRSMESTLLQE
uniref:Bombesin-like protein n=1 Tax=Pelophylax lessonae TaxID=45623 RepID=A0A344Q118_PELLE|nr:bombesin-like protein precursor [Pelophylax lessonae]